MLKFCAIVVNYKSSKETISCIKSLEKSCSTTKGKVSLSVVLVNNSNEKFNLKDFNDIKIIESGKNIGLSAAWFLGFYNNVAQSCDYIILINNDATVKINFFNNLKKGINKWGGNCIFGPRIYSDKNRDFIWSYGGKINKWIASVKHYEKDLKNSKKDSRNDFETFHLSGCCLIISKKDLEEIGGPNVNYFFRGEEWDLNYRLSKNGKKLILLDELEIYHKINSSHDRYEPKMLYYAYAAKSLFAKTIMPRWYFNLWWILSIPYTLFIATNKFHKNSSYSKKMIRKYLIKGLFDGKKNAKISSIEFKD